MTAPAGVLITRPRPAADATGALVAARGFAPVIAPALVIRSRPIRLESVPAAIAVTSGNALAGLPAGLHAVPVFAVGDATAAKARAAGFSEVTSAGADAAALAALIARAAPPGPLLLAVGEGQGAALERSLRARGRAVDRQVLYAAQPADALPAEAVAAVRAGRVRFALFFSAETARAFVRLAATDAVEQALGAVTACAIGRSAVMALEPIRWREIRLADHPNQEAMLALLQ
ncbi:MAG: uroporphyrinogen-III synthase [Rhodospirillales bacterium]|nr:uroporphyrinogen-III synthase [Rhodospirillales bacterium]